MQSFYRAHRRRLNKALEGIKQGAYLWFAHNKAAWLKLGLKAWMNEPNLYRHEGLRIRIGVFADDTLAGYPKEFEQQYKAMKAEYAKMINIGSTAISPALRFTGSDVERDRAAGTVTISQRTYIKEMAKEYAGRYEQYDTPFGNSKEDRALFEKLHEAERPRESRSPRLNILPSAGRSSGPPP